MDSTHMQAFLSSPIAVCMHVTQNISKNLLVSRTKFYEHYDLASLFLMFPSEVIILFIAKSILIMLIDFKHKT